MRIAIVAFGSRGDVQPHIALGAGLRAAGYDVCLVTHALFEPLIRRLGLDFYPVEVDPRDVVENEKGAVASFVTDDQGHFRISLPPGHYTVSIKEKKPAIGRYGPFEVDVVTGQMTKVQWHCDTGMR